MISEALFTSDKNYWETPDKLFKQLDNAFHFTLDPCSTDKNAKCKKHYTVETNGLVQNWGGEIVFCNPPYGRKDTGIWVQKCHESSKNAIVVLLIPARTDTKYFHDYIYHKHPIYFIKGRLKFELDGEPMQSAPFPSMIVVMKPEDWSKQNETNRQN